MGKITFRADDDLVSQLEAFDASKSEVMREALRAYLDERAVSDTYTPSAGSTGHGGHGGETIDDLICERIDAALERRSTDRQQDVHVTIALEGASPARGTATHGEREPRQTGARRTPAETREQSNTSATGDRECAQCGSSVDTEHVFCPNCGEKASRRLFCECGDEVRSDWAFCPSCGRRTPAADVLDSS